MPVGEGEDATPMPVVDEGAVINAAVSEGVDYVVSLIGRDVSVAVLAFSPSEGAVLASAANASSAEVAEAMRTAIASLAKPVSGELLVHATPEEVRITLPNGSVLGLVPDSARAFAEGIRKSADSIDRRIVLPT